MIRKIKSIEIKENYEEGKDLKKFLLVKCEEKLGGNCLLIVFKYNQVYIGSIVNNEINVLEDKQFTLDYVTEIRMFSVSGELHLWKYGDVFKWRLRIDEEVAGDINIYEETHIMWGTEVNDEKKNELIEEHRGMKIRFPRDINDEPLPIQYKVRNYFNFDDDGMIKFYDARLVQIFNYNRGVING